MPEPWERQPTETQRAFECFAVFRDDGPSRKLIDAYRKVTGRTEACRLSGSWNIWVDRYDWWSRSAAYDAMKDRERVEAKREADRQAHLRDLEEFRKTHLHTARKSFANAQGILKSLQDFLVSQPKVESWDDAIKAQRVLGSYREVSEMWANALGISTLLEQLDASEGE